MKPTWLKSRVPCLVCIAGAWSWSLHLHIHHQNQEDPWAIARQSLSLLRHPVNSTAWSLVSQALSSRWACLLPGVCAELAPPSCQQPRGLRAFLTCLYDYLSHKKFSLEEGKHRKNWQCKRKLDLEAKIDLFWKPNSRAQLSAGWGSRALAFFLWPLCLFKFNYVFLPQFR